MSEAKIDPAENEDLWDAKDEEPMTNVESQWRAKEAAKFLSCSISWIYKAAARGEIPCVRIGAMLRFDPEQLRAFAKAHAIHVREAAHIGDSEAAA